MSRVRVAFPLRAVGATLCGLRRRWAEANALSLCAEPAAKRARAAAEELAPAAKLALRDLDAAVQQTRVYSAALKAVFHPTLALPCYATLPPHPSLQYTVRRRFALHGGNFTFMHRLGSRELVDWLMQLLERCEFAAYVKGPQGVGKSHLLYEACLLLSAKLDFRVVYEHDCSSWANLANTPIKAALYFLRSIAMAFAQDTEVLQLCKQFIASVSIVSDAVEAEDAVCNDFLPRLGELCHQLNLKVFFVFDQHDGLTPTLRATFPFSLPEARLLHTSQLHGVGMVVICATANNEYFLKVATMEPPLPTRLLTSGFDLDELRIFLQHEQMFQHPALGETELQALCVATNRYPLELAFLRDAHHALRKSGVVSVTWQRCLDVYELGDSLLGIDGRTKNFAARIAAFDQRVRGDPSKRQRVINGVVRMKYELPVSDFPCAPLLNLAICYESPVPQSISCTQQAPHGGPAAYIHPVTPSALKAAIAFYQPDPAYSEQEAAVVCFVFQSLQHSRDVKGRLLEAYILQKLSTSRALQLYGREYGADNTPASKQVLLADVRGLQTVRWRGDVPAVDLELRNDLFLWPSSPKYEGVDAMLWLAGSKTLLLLQITFSAVGGHKSNFWAAHPTLLSQWMDKLGPKKVNELWLTPYPNAGESPTHQGQYVCTLAELLVSNAALFPFLKFWEPASERTQQ